MLTLSTLRLGLIVAAVLATMAGVYFVFDAIGDVREAKVWAKIDKAIDTVNDETEEANTEDAQERAVRQKLRTSALQTAAKLTPTNQCKLTAEDARVIGAVQ